MLRKHFDSVQNAKHKHRKIQEKIQHRPRTRLGLVVVGRCLRAHGALCIFLWFMGSFHAIQAPVVPFCVVCVRSMLVDMYMSMHGVRG